MASSANEEISIFMGKEEVLDWTSWDSILPVANKIESLGFSVDFKEEGRVCRIYLDETNPEAQIRTRAESRLISLCKAVSEFCFWFNNEAPT